MNINKWQKETEHLGARAIHQKHVSCVLQCCWQRKVMSLLNWGFLTIHDVNVLHADNRFITLCTTKPRLHNTHASLSLKPVMFSSLRAAFTHCQVPAFYGQLLINARKRAASLHAQESKHMPTSTAALTHCTEQKVHNFWFYSPNMLA